MTVLYTLHQVRLHPALHDASVALVQDLVHDSRVLLMHIWIIRVTVFVIVIILGMIAWSGQDPAILLAMPLGDVMGQVRMIVFNVKGTLLSMHMEPVYETLATLA